MMPIFERNSKVAKKQSGFTLLWLTRWVGSAVPTRAGWDAERKYECKCPKLTSVVNIFFKQNFSCLPDFPKYFLWKFTYRLLAKNTTNIFLRISYASLDDFFLKEISSKIAKYPGLCRSSRVHVHSRVSGHNCDKKQVHICKTLTMSCSGRSVIH